MRKPKTPRPTDLDGEVNGYPAFRCTAATAPDGSRIWEFNCTCGRRHTHGTGEGHRIAHCVERDTHPRGYYLLPPVG